MVSLRCVRVDNYSSRLNQKHGHAAHAFSAPLSFNWYFISINTNLVFQQKAHLGLVVLPCGHSTGQDFIVSGSDASVT